MTGTGSQGTAGAELWPDGVDCAVAFTFDFDAEEVWLADDAGNADRPGVLSQGRYGAKVGLPLVLDILSRHIAKATFFVPGRVAERYPERVSEIVAAGHELAHHGYTHVSPTLLGAQEEEAELVKGKAILERFAPVAGYRSPSWEFSPRTLELLERHGFGYSSNFMDDIRPYRHHGSPIVELPVHWILDDAPHFWFAADTWEKKIATVGEVKELWRAEFEGIRRLGGCCIFTMHPQLIGRPGRLGLLESMVRMARETEGVWLASAGELAAWFGSAAGEA